MSYRPITWIRGPGIAVVRELYGEQQDARNSQVAVEEQIRAADPTRGRFVGRLVGGFLLAVVLIGVVAIVATPRSAQPPTPAGMSSLATLAGTNPVTTTFSGRVWTITFTAANPNSVLSAARLFAEQHGYAFDTPTDGGVAFDISGPQGGVAIGYFSGGGAANTDVRIMVDASDLTADGSALK